MFGPAGHALRLLHLRHALVHERRLRPGRRGGRRAAARRRGRRAASTSRGTGGQAARDRDRSSPAGRPGWPGARDRPAASTAPTSSAGSPASATGTRVPARGPAGATESVAAAGVAVAVLGRRQLRSALTGPPCRARDPVAGPADRHARCERPRAVPATCCRRCARRTSCCLRRGPDPARGRPGRAAAGRQRERRPLRVKLGIDPTGSDLHLGHAVVLRKLRQFQDLGHTAVLIVGDFTGQVGDPSGKTATRPRSSPEQVDAQRRDATSSRLMRILDPDRSRSAQRRLARHDGHGRRAAAHAAQLTVAQLLERDDFARGSPRSTADLADRSSSTRCCRAIDSVEVEADVELGGTDQTFNNLVGRDAAASAGPGAAGGAHHAAAGGHRRRREDGQVARQLRRHRRAGRTEQFGKLMSHPGRADRAVRAACAPRCIRTEVSRAGSRGGRSGGTGRPTRRSAGWPTQS